jgi:hypothetical protein
MEDGLYIPSLIATITDLVWDVVGSLGLNSRWPSKASQKEESLFE